MPDIATLAEHLTKELLEYEAALIAQRFEVKAEVPLDETHNLVFKRTDKKWALVVTCDIKSTCVPIGSTGVQIRIRAVGQLEALHAALLVAQKDLKLELLRAIERTRVLTKELREK